MNAVAVRLVDAWIDNDSSTRDSCPGKINKHNLVKIGIQRNRRLKFWRKQKYIIYQEKGTRNIWYKSSKCNAGVIAMGFSRRRLDLHPKAVSMEEYATYFIDKADKEWLKRNDYELI